MGWCKIVLSCLVFSVILSESNQKAVAPEKNITNSRIHRIRILPNAQNEPDREHVAVLKHKMGEKPLHPLVAASRRFRPKIVTSNKSQELPSISEEKVSSNPVKYRLSENHSKQDNEEGPTQEKFFVQTNNDLLELRFLNVDDPEELANKTNLEAHPMPRVGDNISSRPSKINKIKQPVDIVKENNNNNAGESRSAEPLQDDNNSDELEVKEFPLSYENNPEKRPPAFPTRRCGDMGSRVFTSKNCLVKSSLDGEKKPETVPAVRRCGDIGPRVFTSKKNLAQYSLDEEKESDVSAPPKIATRRREDINLNVCTPNKYDSLPYDVISEQRYLESYKSIRMLPTNSRHTYCPHDQSSAGKQGRNPYCSFCGTYSYSPYNQYGYLTTDSSNNAYFDNLRPTSYNYLLSSYNFRVSSYSQPLNWYDSPSSVCSTPPTELGQLSFVEGNHF